MFKVLILTLALVSVSLAETSFQVAPKDFKSEVVAGDLVSHGVGYSARSAQIFAIPPDEGGNWGDNLWGAQGIKDTLITREIQINEVYSTEQSFKWQANYPNKKISHVRLINIGRQRAYVDTVTGNANGGPTATAVIQVAPNQQFRLLIEVYVK